MHASTRTEFPGLSFPLTAVDIPHSRIERGKFDVGAHLWAAHWVNAFAGSSVVQPIDVIAYWNGIVVAVPEQARWVVDEIISQADAAGFDDAAGAAHALNCAVRALGLDVAWCGERLT